MTAENGEQDKEKAYESEKEEESQHKGRKRYLNEPTCIIYLSSNLYLIPLLIINI